MKKRLSLVLAVLLVAIAVFGIISAKNAAPIFDGRSSISEQGLNYIKEVEGFTPNATEQGNKTLIGYGCTVEQAKTYGFPTDQLSEQEAENLLMFVIRNAEKSLRSFTAHEGLNLKRHQYDALIAFTIDEGTDWLDNDSPLKDVLSRRSYTAADFSIAMSTYCQASGGTYSDDLISRRIRDVALFLYGNYGKAAAEANITVLRFLSQDETPEMLCLYPAGIAYQNLPAAEPNFDAAMHFAGWYTADGEKVTSETIATADLAEVQAKWVGAEEISEATAEDYDPQLTHAGKAYKSSSNKTPLERQYSVGSVVLRALNKGFVLTLKLFAITLLGALPLGLLISFGSMSKFAPLKYVTKTIVWIFRGSPLLLQLMIVFYMPGLLFGVNPWAFSDGRFWAAATAFILNYACYFSEIYRGGIQSVPVGQTEAGLVLGMTKTQIFFKVKLMQLVKRILPPMSNEIITLVKDTSLANTIGLLEVIYQGKSFMKSDGLIWPLFFTGVYYLAFTGILTLFLGWLERKLNYFRV